MKEGLNTKQLYQALMSNKLTRKVFDGVYSRDTLEDIIVQPRLIICNTDPSSQPGEHWLLFFFNDDGDSVDFFDSLGKKLSSYGEEFVNFVKRYSHKMTFTRVRTQPKNTDYCGHYCLFYSLCKVLKYESKEIVHCLSKMTSKDVLNVVDENFYFCDSSTSSTTSTDCRVMNNLLQCCNTC